VDIIIGEFVPYLPKRTSVPDHDTAVYAMPCSSPMVPEIKTGPKKSGIQSGHPIDIVNDDHI
jgi:hypothetical protein